MNNKKYKIISGGVLVIALVAMIGIVYAAYSQTLNINGDATVKANSWNVHFANLSEVEITGEAKEITKPSIKNNSTTIGDYSVLLSKPGDTVTYDFDIVNDGTFFAGLVDYKYSTPECTGTGENAIKDAENVCKNLKYSISLDNLTNSGSFPLYYQESWSPDEHKATGGCVKNCILNPRTMLNDDFGTSKIRGHIRIIYEEGTADELPENDVVISNLSAQINFRQIDKPCTKPSDYNSKGVESGNVDWGDMNFDDVDWGSKGF